MKSQLVLERPGNHHFVRGVSAEGIRIGDRVVTGSLVLGANTLLDDWPPDTVDELEEAHFEAVLALEPEVVLLGTGAKQHFLHPSRLAPFHRRGIGIEVMTTEAACRTFNVLAMEERRVVAALLPL